MKIKCLFGFHIWHYLDLANEPFKRRNCLNCGKKQIWRNLLEQGQ